MREILNDGFLSVFLQVFVCVAFGFALRRKNIVGDDGKKVVKTVVWNLMLPCMAFTSFMQDFSVRDLASGAGVLIGSLAFYLGFILVGKMAFKKTGADCSSVIALSASIGQLTLFSMPLASALGLERAVFCCGIMTLSFRFVLYFIAYPMILSERAGLSQVKKILLSPVMIAMLSGLFVWLTQGVILAGGVPLLRIDRSLPAVYAVAKTFSGMVCPLAMIMIGMIFGECDLKSALSDRRAWAGSLLRSVICPLIVFLVTSAIPSVFDGQARLAMVLGFGAPASATFCTFCVTAGKEGALSSRIVVLSTALCLFFVPVFTILTMP